MYKLFIFALLTTITLGQTVTYEFRAGNPNVNVVVTDENDNNMVSSKLTCNPAPRLIDGKMMVPLSFIRDISNSKLDWDPKTKTAKLTSSLEIYFEEKGDFVDNFRKRLVTLLSEAEKSIYVEMYLLSDDRDGNCKSDEESVYQTLVSKSKLDVKLILDNSYDNYKENCPAFHGLKDNGLKVKWDWIDSRYTPMHRKLCIIDSKYVIMGSTNWTPAGLNCNGEVNIIIESTEIAKLFEDEFCKDWERCEPISDNCDKK